MSKRRKFDQYKSVITKSLESSDTEIIEAETPTIPSVSAAIERTGGVSKARTLFLVDVDQCTPWAYADRHQSQVTDVNCAHLIDDIRKHGQKVPAIARKSDQNSDFKYEIISGRRRLFACSKTKERKILIDLRNVEDKEAAQIMVMENENREDISEIERAINMFRQYKGGMWDTADEMRRAYSDMDSKKYSQSAFSRILKAGKISLYEDVLCLFNPISSLKIRPARELVDLLEKDESTKKETLKRAHQIKKAIAAGQTVPSLSILKQLSNTDVGEQNFRKDGSPMIKNIGGIRNAIEIKENKGFLNFKINKKAIDKVGIDPLITELKAMI